MLTWGTGLLGESRSPALIHPPMITRPHFLLRLCSQGDAWEGGGKGFTDP